MINIKSIFKNILFFGFIMGSVVGAFCWSFLFLIELLTKILWNDLPDLLNINNFPIAIVLCPIGGLLIGLGQMFLGRYPKEMEETLHEYKVTKTINYKSLPKYSICAILPLIFGGSIGPEAGLFGMIAMFSTFLSVNIKNSNPELKEEFIETSTSAVLTSIFQVPLLSPFSFDKNSIIKIQLISRKILNYVTYGCTALSAFYVIKSLNHLSNRESFIFQLSKNPITIRDLLFLIPMILISLFIGLSFMYIGNLIEYCSSKFKITLHPFIASVAGGLILALLGAYDSHILFSGEHTIKQISLGYKELGIVYLILIAFLKILATKISINLRWIGGQIFPTIFASFNIAFALSIIFNIDSSFLIASMATGIVTVVLKKPVIAVVLLCCFLPYTYWIYAIISAFTVNYFNKKHIRSHKNTP